MNIKEVVIVDDQSLFIEGLSKLLGEIENVRVITSLISGENIYEKLKILQPDVLFLDLNLPGKNGLEILKTIRHEYPTMIIAILTMYEDQLLINKARELHANAYLTKDASLDELTKIIFSAPDDPFYVSRSINQQKEDENDIMTDTFTDIGLITNREKEIISLIAQGKNTAQISKELYISVETVKTHRKNIFRKLNLKKTAELLKFAYENNLL